jgi:hypothetical protein
VKLGKTSWIFLVIGVVLIASVFLSLTYSRQRDEQSQVNSQLTAAKQKLALSNNDELLAQKEQINKQIDSYYAQIDSTKSKLSSSKDSISATNDILFAAQTTGVEVVGIDSPGLSTEQLRGTLCETLTINIQVAGDVVSIGAFVKELSRIFPTSIAQTVQVSSAVSTPTPTPTPTPSPTPTPTPTDTVTPTPTSTYTPPPPPTIPPVVAVVTSTSASVELIIYSYKGG